MRHTPPLCHREERSDVTISPLLKYKRNTDSSASPLNDNGEECHREPVTEGDDLTSFGFSFPQGERNFGYL
jgi:hypothetical protein